MSIDLPDAFWSILAAVVVLTAVLAGLPRLIRGGSGRSRSGRRGRARYGPSTSGLLVLAALRGVDTLALAAATVAVVVLLAVNATG